MIKTSFGLALAVVSVNSVVVGWTLQVMTLIDPAATTDPSAFSDPIVYVAFGGTVLGVFGLFYFGWAAMFPALISAAVWTYVMQRVFRPADVT